MPRLPVARAMIPHAMTPGPDEAIARRKHHLATRLEPGEAGSPWQPYGKGTPAFVVGAVRRVRPVSGPGPGD